MVSPDVISVVLVSFTVLLLLAMLSVTVKGVWSNLRDRRSRIRAAWVKRFGEDR